MRERIYGKHGYTFGTGTRAQAFVKDFWTAVAMAAFIGLPIWFFFLGI